ncbi:MAG: TIGR03087 family PEP-CTERM/XrtA system glycosyltransferase [Kordiimonadaceae bacterium]|nr:TIGR03087 family PEP-CTERM/XrtA system glycosyltransferase [Kordiimonadaceae bacterium]
MKILFLSHRFPYPPTRGDKIRSFNMVKYLHEQGHQVTVASLSRSPEETAECQGIKDYCHDFILVEINEFIQKIRMVSRLLFSDPSSMGYFYSGELQKKVNRLLGTQKFDLIVVFSSSAAQYVEHVTDTPKMLDFCDMDSQKWLAYVDYKKWPISAGYALEGRKLEADEKRLAKKFDLCSCATDFEVETLDSYGTGVASGYFPNGVDSEFFKPIDIDYQKNSICFVGRMDYYPNEVCIINFCHDVLPIIRKHYPDVTFKVIGAAPPQSVLKLNDLPGVLVTGTVDDIRKHVQSCQVMVAPLVIARGTQNKILEGMAMGLPVVSSHLAARGVDAVVGEHILAATKPEDYAKEIMSLFADPERQRKFSENGRARILSHHTWQRGMDLMSTCIDRTIDEFKRKAA